MLFHNRYMMCGARSRVARAKIVSRPPSHVENPTRGMSGAACSSSSYYKRSQHVTSMTSAPSASVSCQRHGRSPCWGREASAAAAPASPFSKRLRSTSCPAVGTFSGIFVSAVMDLSVREKSPSWAAKKLREEERWSARWKHGGIGACARGK